MKDVILSDHMSAMSVKMATSGGAATATVESASTAIGGEINGANNVAMTSNAKNVIQDLN